ncbi:MAG TPA: hypothetical protein VHR45_21875 [Thermoanaerobaculia bacterium]|nr:hypothetical protein [Thermoanaerobaculia bacterium]
MDPETLATITGLAGAAKASIEAIRAALGTRGRGSGKPAKETLGLIDDLQARILQLQEIALRLSRELAQAQEENTQLREQVRQKEERAADRERYEQRRVGQSVVVVAKENPEVYLCATCFEAGAKVYLTKLPRLARNVGTHSCPRCKGIVGAR